jgi:hypothetical protein
MEDMLDLRPELKLIRDALLALQEKLLDFERADRRPPQRPSLEERPPSRRRNLN